METKNISMADLEVNKGQLYGLPANPRFIRDTRFEALKKSISDRPEMLELRELLVYPMDNGKYIIIGGNMRFRACTDLGYTEIPCKVIPKETPVAVLREYTIKDNEGFGQNDWDMLANEWNQEELEGWGMELTWASNPYVEGAAPDNGDDDLPIDDFSDKNKEIDLDDEDGLVELKLKFKIEEHTYVRQQLAKIDGNIETALLKLLKYEIKDEYTKE